MWFPFSIVVRCKAACRDKPIDSNTTKYKHCLKQTYAPTQGQADRTNTNKHINYIKHTKQEVRCFAEFASLPFFHIFPGKSPYYVLIQTCSSAPSFGTDRATTLDFFVEQRALLRSCGDKGPHCSAQWRRSTEQRHRDTRILHLNSGRFAPPNHRSSQLGSPSLGTGLHWIDFPMPGSG